ncbi:hypothetical protein L9F63_014216, partial [Diploptera punctata]
MYLHVEEKKISQFRPCNILRWLKPLCIVSKYFGLLPFTLTAEADLEGITMLGILEFAWPAIVFLIIFSGFVYCVMTFNLKSKNPGCVAHAFVVPANYITALTTLVINSTINRNKIQRLIYMMCKLTRLYLVAQLTVLFLLCAPFLYYDAYFWSFVYRGSIFEFVKRTSILINLVLIIQFANIMYFFQRSLWSINEFLAKGKHVKQSSNTSSNFVNASQSNNVLQPDSSGFIIDAPVLKEMNHISSRICKNTKCSSHYISASNSDYFKIPSKKVTKSCNLKIGNLPRICKRTPPLSVICNHKGSVLSTAEIIRLRIVYKHLYYMLKLTNCIYGLPILFLLTFCFIGTVSYSYATLYLIIRDEKSVLLFIHISWFILLIGSAIYVSTCSHMTQSESKRTLDEILNCLLDHSIERKLGRQLKLFSNQVSKNLIEFEAFGVFSVNLPLLCSFIGSATTFIIILIQFQL